MSALEQITALRASGFTRAAAIEIATSEMGERESRRVARAVHASDLASGVDTVENSD